MKNYCYTGRYETVLTSLAKVGTGRILERNRIVGLPLPKQKIPTGTERYLKH